MSGNLGRFNSLLSRILICSGSLTTHCVCVQRKKNNHVHMHSYAYASAQGLHTHTYTHPSIHPSIHPCMHACIHTYVQTYNIHPQGVCLYCGGVEKKGCQECSEFRDIGVSEESGLGLGDSGVSGIAGSILEPQNSSCGLFMFRVW